MFGYDRDMNDRMKRGWDLGVVDEFEVVQEKPSEILTACIRVVAGRES
jgi:hypothetical protein